MAKIKADYVIESVRYTDSGKIDLVRVYERRFTAFSDHVLKNREELLELIKAGKTIMTGKRHVYRGGEFDLDKQVKQVGDNISTSNTTKKDDLQGIPQF